MSRKEPLSLEARAKYNAMEEAIKDYFLQLWEDHEAAERGDFIGDWAVVVHADNLLDNGVSQLYVVETATGMPPHHIKGLLSEGIDWVVDRVMEARDDDE